ncbi:MAG: hypothetical protein KC475_00935 [Cyanobacteria bacterium HKST-UBA03]|nr:hypothetical protein [Cyanobacteria bacterium HKST-UBA03]
MFTEEQLAMHQQSVFTRQKSFFNRHGLLLGVLGLCAVLLFSTTGCVVQSWRRAEAVREAYVDVIGKEPTVEQLNFWVKQVEDGMPIEEVRKELYSSDEYYEQLVVTTFTDLYGHPPSEIVQKRLVDRLKSGAIKPNRLKARLMKTARYKNFAAHKQQTQSETRKARRAAKQAEAEKEKAAANP